MTGTGNLRTERKRSTTHLGMIAVCAVLQCAVTADATGVRPAVPCPCEADGVCRPNRLEWGYYHTNWRRWPGDTPTAAEAEAEAEEQLKEELPGFQRPQPADEDLRGPAQPDRGKDDEDAEAAEGAAPADGVPVVPPLQGRGPVLSLPIAAGVAAAPGSGSQASAPARRPYMPAPLGLVDPFETIPDPAGYHPAPVQASPVQPAVVTDPLLHDMPPVLPSSLGESSSAPASHVGHAAEPAGAPAFATDARPELAEPAKKTLGLVNPVAQRVVRQAVAQMAPGNASVQTALWAGDGGGVRPTAFERPVVSAAEASDQQ